MPVTDVPGLPYGHEEIIGLAVATFRADYLGRPDPAGLLEEPFTLRDLQLLNEGVAGAALPRDTFRRAMEPLLRAIGETVHGVVGKPAGLFVRAD